MNVFLNHCVCQWSVTVKTKKFLQGVYLKSVSANFDYHLSMHAPQDQTCPEATLHD